MEENVTDKPQAVITYQEAVDNLFDKLNEAEAAETAQEALQQWTYNLPLLKEVVDATPAMWEATMDKEANERRVKFLAGIPQLNAEIPDTFDRCEQMLKDLTIANIMMDGTDTLLEFEMCMWPLFYEQLTLLKDGQQ
jgi:hypothetical protein